MPASPTSAASVVQASGIAQSSGVGSLSRVIHSTSLGQLTSHRNAKLAIGNVQVSHDSFRAHSEPSVAENPANPKNLVAASKFFSDPSHYRFKIGTFYSTNGGRSWHDAGLLPGFADYGLTSDVSIAFSASGIAYVAVLATDGTNGCSKRCGIFVSRSANGGKTFSAPVPVFLDTSGATFSDKPWVAVDRTAGPTAGTIYVAWNLDGTSASSKGGDPDAGVFHAHASGVPQQGLVVSHSSDGGRTFSAPETVAAFTSKQFFIGAIPAVDPSGMLSIVFAQISSKGVNGVDLVQSSDGGQTFTPPKEIQKVVGLPDHLKHSTFRNLSMPTFAVSPADGSMVVAWADYRNGDADILASRSVDGGATWSLPRRVNSDPIHDGKDQFQPALAVAPNGTYTCAWFDRRYDPHDRLIDEVIAQSPAGARFGRNIRVTKKSWDPAIDAARPDGNSNETFIGDYQGLAVNNSVVHPLWNDTQNGISEQIRTATISVTVFRK